MDNAAHARRWLQCVCVPAAVLHYTLLVGANRPPHTHTHSTHARTHILPIKSTEDWHYPAEEGAEMQALLDTGLRVGGLHCDSNTSGTLTLLLANGSSATARVPGDRIFGWTLRGFLCSDSDASWPSPERSSDAERSPGRPAWSARSAGGVAVLEFDSARWGLVAFLGPAGRLGHGDVLVSGGHVFRKGVGRVPALRRPALDPRLTTSAYYEQALADPADALTKAMEGSTPFKGQ